MEVNASTLVALQQSLNALFQQSLQSATPLWPTHAMEVPSSHETETYQWLGRVPQMRRWIDTKIIQGLSGFQYQIRNDPYESTIAVKRNDILFDKLGMYQPRISEMGLRARYHPDKLLSEARAAGATTNGYDEQPFYGITHTEGNSGAQSNYLQGTGTAVNDLMDDLYAAMQAMMTYKDNQNEPFIEPAVLAAAKNMPFKPWVVTAPPAMFGAFDKLQKATMLDSSDNTVAGSFDLVIDSRLTDVNDWYLDFVGGAIKPFIKQTVIEPHLVALTDPNSTERVFMTAEFLYGVESLGALGYGLWQFSIQTHN